MLVTYKPTFTVSGIFCATDAATMKKERTARKKVFMNTFSVKDIAPWIKKQ
jgi:hypothetical protein